MRLARLAWLGRRPTLTIQLRQLEQLLDNLLVFIMDEKTDVLNLEISWRPKSGILIAHPIDIVPSNIQPRKKICGKKGLEKY